MAQGAYGEHHAATGLAALYQASQALHGIVATQLDTIEQCLLQRNVQRQQRMEFRWHRRLLATIGLAQALQPGLRQVGTPLGQPQFAFDQGNHGQIVDRGHIPYMHQTLGLGQFGKGLGKVTFPAIERGNHAMADEHTDVPARSRLPQPRAQTRPALSRLQARDQQVTFVKRQARTHGIQPLRRKPLQTLQPLAHFVQRAQHLATGMQHPRPVVMSQRLEQGVADTLGQFQGFTVPASGTPEVTIGNGQVGQRRQAHQALAIALARQAL